MTFNVALEEKKGLGASAQKIQNVKLVTMETISVYTALFLMCLPGETDINSYNSMYTVFM